MTRWISRWGSGIRVLLAVAVVGLAGCGAHAASSLAPSPSPTPTALPTPDRASATAKFEAIMSLFSQQLGAATQLVQNDLTFQEGMDDIANLEDRLSTDLLAIKWPSDVRPDAVAAATAATKAAAVTRGGSADAIVEQAASLKAALAVLASDLGLPAAP